MARLKRRNLHRPHPGRPDPAGGGRVVAVRTHPAAAFRTPRPAPPRPSHRAGRGVGRFEAEGPTNCGSATPCTRPVVAGRNVSVAFIDRSHRAVMGTGSATPKTLSASRALLRTVIRGVPGRSTSTTVPFVDSWLLRACAAWHQNCDPPPAVRRAEEIERSSAPSASSSSSRCRRRRRSRSAELNRLFTAWVETNTTKRPHTSRTSRRWARWRQKLPARATPTAALRERLVVGAPHGTKPRRCPAQHITRSTRSSAAAKRARFDPFDLPTQVRHMPLLWLAVRSASADSHRGPAEHVRSPARPDDY